mgnify:CR=1 FL=1
MISKLYYMFNNSREYIKKVKDAMIIKKVKKLKQKDLFYTDSSNDRSYKKKYSKKK